MNSKPRKKAKNGFSFFLDEYVEGQKKNGRILSHKIGAEECSVLWKDLPEAEKQRYGKIAAASKELLKSDKNKKFTTWGISYAELERKQELQKKKIKDADTEIQQTLTNLTQDSLCTHLFYLVHCNYYCKTDSGMYLPGEIALCEFSLKDGIRRTYHTLINPGQIPLGFAYETQQNIDDVHRLPYPPYSEGNSDYSNILQEILNFLLPGKFPDGRYPPVYCLERNIKATENILEYFSSFKACGERYFRVYALHKMFFALKNKCSEYGSVESNFTGFPVLSNAVLEIEKDIFCYVPGISCNFHCNMEEKYQNCSLSVVQRYVYIICDHCCYYLNIGIIPGKHSRIKCDTNRRKTEKNIEARAEKNQINSVLPDKKSDIVGISYSYSGSKAPKQTEITTSRFSEDEMLHLFSELKCVGKAAEQPIASSDNSRKISSIDYSTYNQNFPVLCRRRGKRRKI